MKISRWINFPLIYTIFFVSWMIIWYWVIGMPYNPILIWLWLINGLLMGFFLLYYSHRKAKKLSNDADDERIHEARQNRNLVVLLDYGKTFNLCREAILTIKKSKIKSENFEAGEIKAKCRLKWDLPRQKIGIRLKKINENLTEIELLVLPHLKTVVIGSGYTWRAAEDLCNYLKEKDAEINKKVLADSVGIMEDVYVKLFQKERVENMKP
jgi:hypothetical protein